MNKREHEPTSAERSVEVAQGAHERSQELAERLKQSPEHYSENEAHATAEKARNEAFKEALFSKEQDKEKRANQVDGQSAAPIITKQDRDISFQQTMNRVQKELPPSARPFSKFIHLPAVERTSEVLGNTVARPNAILAGGISAFVMVLALYSYARYAGFSLQGSETIIAFVLGWLVGILYDFFRVMLTGKK